MNYIKQKLKASSVPSVISNIRLMKTALRLIVLIGASLSYTMVQAELTAPKLNHQLTRLDMPVKAPSFSLEDMDGDIYSSERLKGEVVMINFWATWCPPCRREMPSMEYIYQEFKDDAFTVIAINQWETPDHVFAYMGELDVFPNFPILFDINSTVSEDYKVKGLPTTFLINKRGEVVYRAVGGRDFNHSEIKDIVKNLILGSDKN